MSSRDKKKIMRELISTVLARRSKMCNILEYKDLKVVYKRYGVRGMGNGEGFGNR